MSVEGGWLLYEGVRQKDEYTYGAQSRIVAEKVENSRVVNTKQKGDEKERKRRKKKREKEKK